VETKTPKEEKMLHFRKARSLLYIETAINYIASFPPLTMKKVVRIIKILTRVRIRLWIFQHLEKL